MIKKVYRTDTITKTKMVKKEVIHREPKYRIEQVTVNSKKGYCGRCGNYFNYGDNKRNPDSCPYCICKDCGVSIQDRKKSISGFSHSKVDRCYSCWHLWYRGYRKGGIGYEVVYNHTKPVKGIIENKRIEYYDEWKEYKEEEEKYTENKTTIVYPKKVKYNINNKIHYNILTLPSLLKTKITNIKNEDLNSEEGWYGTRDVDVDFQKFYTEPIPENNYQMWGITNIVFNEMIVSEKQTLEEFCDVVGFYPNVPAFIQGHPLSMYNNKRKNIIDLVKSVTIFVNLAVDSVTDYKQYQLRGNMINGLIDEILSTSLNPNESVKVNLCLLDATYIDGETIIQKIDIQHDELMKNKNIVYNLLTNISFFRLLLLDKKIEFIKKEKLDVLWGNGQGFILNNDNIREILNLMDTDILIGSIEEIGITGIHLDDDHVNFLSSIGLLEDNIIDSIESNINEISIHEVIKNRNITKLIHVTNKKNLDSILKHGILPLTNLEKDGINYEFNDPLRLEKRRDAICLSVTDYNNFLFGSFQKKYPKNEYVVLEIDPQILLIEGIEKVFCDYNAASRFSNKSTTNMEIMFKEKIKRRAKIKTRTKKEKNEPTSYQAEILYCGKIDSKYIMNHYDLGKIKLH